MGMTMTLAAVDGGRLADLVADPAAVDAFLDEVDAAYARTAPGVPGPAAAAEAEAREVACDLDKAWHAIHWLLTGEAEEAPLPAGGLLGGLPVGEDLGYGPARVLTPEETTGFAALLAEADRATLFGRFDFAALEKAGIYPPVWGRRDHGDMSYVLDYADDLRAFVAARAERGEGLVIVLA